MDIKRQIEPNTVRVGDFNDTIIKRHVIQTKKINKEILELNDTLDQMDLADVYKVFYPAQHNIHSSQQPLELTPKYSIF
jgi:hypothetical protein